MIETRAPGKLFIAGEYAVVEPGEPAVVVAVDRYVTVTLVESHDVGRVHSSAYGSAPMLWVRDGDGIRIESRPADYVASAIATVEQLRAERGVPPRYSDLHIESELDDASGRKFGLGSSAAVTVAVIAALDIFYGLALTRSERFKLALLAAVEVAPAGSGGDLAASTYGGWIRYTAPDRGALRAHRAAHGVTSALAAPAWASWSVTPLPAPRQLELLVGWTGSPASTELLVDRLHRGDAHGGAAHAAFLAESRAAVDALVAALRDDETAAPAAIRRARLLLQEFGATAGLPIETEELRALCDLAEGHGAAGKPSGAGGGDCGIVLIGDGADAPALLADWERHGIHRLPLTVQPAVNDGSEGGADVR